MDVRFIAYNKNPDNTPNPFCRMIVVIAELVPSPSSDTRWSLVLFAVLQSPKARMALRCWLSCNAALWRHVAP